MTTCCYGVSSCQHAMSDVALSHEPMLPLSVCIHSRSGSRILLASVILCGDAYFSMFTCCPGCSCPSKVADPHAIEAPMSAATISSNHTCQEVPMLACWSNDPMNGHSGVLTRQSQALKVLPICFTIFETSCWAAAPSCKNYGIRIDQN